jgi:two-component system, LytTR family, sensor kinase
MTTSFSGKTKILLLYLGWWSAWLAAQVYVLTQLDFPWHLAATDAAVTQSVLALAGYVINTSMHSYRPSGKNGMYVLVWSVVLAALCAALQRWLLIDVFAVTVEYTSFLTTTLLVRGAFAWLMIVLVAVLTWFWVYVAEKQETESRKQDNERLMREAELSSLRLQLQPHFLFNSLNSINALVGTEPERARMMIQQVSDFLRNTVRKETMLVTLEEELAHLQLYLEIEKVRFSHRLQTELNISPETKAMKVPSLLLQPVVENAIKFGLYDTVDQVMISIVARAESGVLIIEVKNPFDPLTAQPKTGTGFGLTSVQRRLYLLFAQNNLLQTRQEENYFVTTLRIPQT